MSVLEEWCKKRVIEKMVRDMNIDGDWVDDLIQEVYLVLLEKGEEFVSGLIVRKEINFYVSRIIMNMVMSCTSRFYKTYRSNNNKVYKTIEEYE